MTLNFKAPLDESSDEDALKQINYQEFRIKDELKLLKTRKFEEYGYVQCLKICHYLQQMRQIEILQMQAEFIRDDCDNVWFSYARKIQYRRCANPNAVPGFSNEEEAERQAKQFQKAQTDLFTRELQDYQEAIEA